MTNRNDQPFGDNGFQRLVDICSMPFEFAWCLISNLAIIAICIVWFGGMAGLAIAGLMFLLHIIGFPVGNPFDVVMTYTN